MKYLVSLFFAFVFHSCAFAQTALVIFAHPDDELMANGSIAHFINNGVDVHVAYSTSGKYGHDVRGIIHDPIELSVQRELEATEALDVVGVKSSNIHFLRMDDYSQDVYKMAAPLDQLFRDISPELVITFGPEGLYGHVDHRRLSQVVSYTFNSSSTAQVLLHSVVSESKDIGYEFTHGAGKPTQGYDFVHRIADESINYQIDVSAYTDLQQESVAKYVSQFSPEAIALIGHFYGHSVCPNFLSSSESLAVCEQFILAGIKPGLDSKAILDPLNFYSPK